jgi:hypothetical protein
MDPSSNSNVSGSPFKESQNYSPFSYRSPRVDRSPNSYSPQGYATDRTTQSPIQLSPNTSKEMHCELTCRFTESRNSR